MTMHRTVEGEGAMATLRLLIVEDDPTDAELVIRELRKSGFEPQFRRVDTREAFMSGMTCPTS
jgi:hypothetical protein